MANTVTPLENFDCEGDPISLGTRWEKWKRALLLYLEASGTTDYNRKKALLLHSGGISLQEIFYNLPNTTNEGQDTPPDSFENALKKLDNYFAPKQSIIYERHIFRLLKQEDDEKFDTFLLRLRRQSLKCKFLDVEGNIVDQIVEKCNSKDLRKKILTLGDSATLDDIIKEANTLESVCRQMQKFDVKTNINIEDVCRIDNKKSNTSCTRCGRGNHNHWDINCPAKKQTCHKCNKIGHFRKMCRSDNFQGTKRKLHYNARVPNKFKRERLTQNQESQPSTSKEEVDYIFHLDTNAMCYWWSKFGYDHRFG